MAFVNVPYRLASRQSLSKTDVESVYGEIVKVVGGTYYLNGVAQGPVNGSLDYRNFSSDAGISNAFKAAPYSVFAVTHALPQGAMIVSGTQHIWSVSLGPVLAGERPQGYIIGYSWLCSGLASAVNSGSGVVSMATPGGFTSTLANPTWNNVAAATVVIATGSWGAGPSNALMAGTQFSSALTVTGSVPNNLTFVYWVKALHVK